jgi:hypothetical protein
MIFAAARRYRYLSTTSAWISEVDGGAHAFIARARRCSAGRGGTECVKGPGNLGGANDLQNAFADKAKAGALDPWLRQAAVDTYQRANGRTRHERLSGPGPTALWLRRTGAIIPGRGTGTRGRADALDRPASRRT